LKPSLIERIRLRRVGDDHEIHYLNSDRDSIYIESYNSADDGEFRFNSLDTLLDEFMVVGNNENILINNEKVVSIDMEPAVGPEFEVRIKLAGSRVVERYDNIDEAEARQALLLSNFELVDYTPTPDLLGNAFGIEIPKGG
jgi:hypothetical protein